MPMKHITLQALPVTIRQTLCNQCRRLHARIQHPVPPPSPFVPDTKTFLTLIGRGLSKHESKIPSWEALFSLTSQQLRDSGLEPARARRYLLWWRERYRKGIFGVGGDLKHVTNGVAELRVAQEGNGKAVLTNPPISAAILKASGLGSEESDTTQEVASSQQKDQTTLISAMEEPAYAGMRLVGDEHLQRPSCHGIQYVKGEAQAAVLKVQEGLWEQKRGVKVDGGERRRAEVRAKRMAAERRKAR